MNLATAFSESAQKQPVKVALCWGDIEISYGELHALSLAVAAKLQWQLGVQPGDRVALWVKNCPEFVPAVFGILAAGGVVVPVNNFLKPAEVAFILKDSGAKCVISDASLAEAQAKVAELLPGLNILRTGDFSTLNFQLSTFSPAERSEADLAALLYTSGTTGHPKGAMLTHGNFLHNVASCVAALDVRPDDRIVVALPQFHSFMFTVGTLLPMLSSGGILLLKTLHPFKSVLEEIARHRGTILPSVPSFYRALLAVPEFGKLPLRLCVSGGAPLPVEVFSDFTRKFPFPLREGYGPTESSPVATVNPIYGLNKPGSVGQPIPNVELSIRDEDGKELPIGEIGEICARGPAVFEGYYGNPEATAKALRGGWFHTGDLGRMDDRGLLYITGRESDMYISGGSNVYPREVEEVLLTHSGVAEIAIVGMPDPKWGEIGVAVVVRRAGVDPVDEAALLGFLEGRCAKYRWPRRFVFWDVMPKSGYGKIVKKDIKVLLVERGDIEDMKLQ